MMKYIILVCVGVFTLFLCGRSLEHTRENCIVCAYAGEENVKADGQIVRVQKMEKDTIFGPVRLPEVVVNVKRKA